jgi:hypothetical protein
MFRGTPDPSFNRGPGGGGPGGRGGGPGSAFRLIPPFAENQVNLTEEQRAKVTQLEADTKAQLQKILTREQMKAMEEARPPRGPSGIGGPEGNPPR